MNVYGNTCPMCCGDLAVVAYPGAGATVCLFCGCNAETQASSPSAGRWLDAIPLRMIADGMSDPAMAQALSGWNSPTHDIQIQTGVI